MLFGRFLATALAVFAPHQGCERYLAHVGYADGTWTVRPTACGRRRSWLEPRQAFAEVPATAARRTLYPQFRCHALFAAAKTSWDLEESRPVVSWRDLILTACNP